MRRRRHESGRALGVLCVYIVPSDRSHRQAAVSDQYRFTVWGDTWFELQAKANNHCIAYFGDMPFTFEIDAHAMHSFSGAVLTIEGNVVALQK